MDIGSIVIHVVGGTPVVVRCEAAPGGGIQLVPATNTADLVAETRQALEAQAVRTDVDGLYPCPLALQRAAQFALLNLPADPISLSEAKDLLYPGVPYKAAWARVHRDVAAGRLRAYYVGAGGRPHRYVSRGEVLELAAAQGAAVLQQ
jgi:hypothetical protein